MMLRKVSLENSNFKQAVEDLTVCLAKRVKALPKDSRWKKRNLGLLKGESTFVLRSIAESHYQLGVAQAHCAEYAKAEKSLEAAVGVLNTRIANLKKMKASDDITKEMAELTVLCTEIKERMADHKEMQKGTYKEDKDFVSIFKGLLLFVLVSEHLFVNSPNCSGAEVHEIGTKKAVATA